MSANRDHAERCDTCRFWDAEATECHRHAPVVVSELGLLTPAGAPDPGPSPAADGAWPRTPSDGWCGDWELQIGDPPARDSAVWDVERVAANLFFARMAPSLETDDCTTLLKSLLNQLPPNVRRVIVRANGLDGQPLYGLKEVARQLKMSRENVRSLLAVGEKRLAEIVEYLMRRQGEQQLHRAGN
jgi:hypothetical protein